LADPAIVLLAHGSPDPDWRGPLEAVRDRARALAPDRTIELAFMDFIAPSLHDVVGTLATTHAKIDVVAAFLSPGGNHLKRDIPALVERVAADHPAVDLRLLPGALGESTAVIEALAEAALTWPSTRSPGAGARST
jgi:sirohydrochlorin cobaltochelatase